MVCVVVMYVCLFDGCGRVGAVGLDMDCFLSRWEGKNNRKMGKGMVQEKVIYGARSVRARQTWG